MRTVSRLCQIPRPDCPYAVIVGLTQLLDITRQTILITGFVVAMMLVIEYANVLLRGKVRRWQRKGGWSQYVIAAVLGVLPGCLGPWALVALYSHGLVSVGALVTAMIATSGDEAYVMLALIPGTALKLFAGLMVCGVVAGAATDFALRGKQLKGVECSGLVYHPKEATTLVSHGKVLAQWKAASPVRLGLAAAFLAITGLVATGHIDVDSAWVRVAALAAGLFALFVVAVVPDHFLKEHLWRHVVRRHAVRILLWTFGALLVTHFAVDVLHIDTLSPGGEWTMLAAACLVGVIPESGPHLIFVTMFAKGAAPFSVLLANSIVQDGHGMLPLLGESRRAFVVVKAINLAVGAAVGAAALVLGY